MTLNLANCILSDPVFLTSIFNVCEQLSFRAQNQELVIGNILVILSVAFPLPASRDCDYVLKSALSLRARAISVFPAPLVPERMIRKLLISVS